MTERKWVRTTVERYGNVEPVPDAWSLIGVDGTLFARIWLERNPKDPWNGKWVVLAFYNRRGVEQGFNGAYPSGAEAREAAEMWTGTRFSYPPSSPAPLDLRFDFKRIGLGQWLRDQLNAPPWTGQKVQRP